MEIKDDNGYSVDFCDTIVTYLTHASAESINHFGPLQLPAKRVVHWQHPDGGIVGVTVRCCQ